MAVLEHSGIGVAANNPIRRLAIAGLKLAESLSFLAPLLTRLVIGSSFFMTGRGKLENFDRTAAFFSEIGVPFARANAAFIGSLEMIGGVCILLGFGTRIFSLLLSATMVVALLTADKDNLIKSFPFSLTDVTPWVYGMFLLWLILCGPGRLSVDHVIAGKLHLHEEGDNKKV